MRMVNSLCLAGPGAHGWDGMNGGAHTHLILAGKWQRHRDDGGRGRGAHAGETQEVSTGITLVEYRICVGGGIGGGNRI